MGRNSVKYQYYATFCANLTTVNYGASMGWLSPVLEDPQKLPLTGSISATEASWIGALLCLGGLMGAFLFSWLGDKWGRKIALCLIAIPQFISWIILLFATNVTFLCVSRFISGLGAGGAFVVVPIYVTEISEDHVRGFLGSILVLGCNFGLLMAFVACHYLNYILFSSLFAVIPIVFLVCFIFLPETPTFLIKMNHIKAAENSLRFYRNQRKCPDATMTESFEIEMENLRKSSETTVKNIENKLRRSDFTNRVSRKALLVGVILIIFNQTCGLFAMLNYTSTIFLESGSNLSPSMSAIIVAIIQLCGAYIATMLVDRCGRKFLLTISGSGISLGLACLGSYVLLKTWGYNVQSLSWIPITSFSFVIFIGSWGVLTLPFLVISEILPDKIRNIGSTFCMTLLWIIAFIMLKYFPVISENFGMHGCMFLFAICSVLGTLFVIFVLPETKGKSFDEIAQLLG